MTDETVVNCVPAVQSPSPTAAAAHDGDRGDDDLGDDDPGDDDRGDHHGQAACDQTDLVPGTPVHEAILRLGGDGAEFKLVLLDEQQQDA